MTSRRAAAVAETPTPIEATTDLGTGLVLPIAKALTHIMAVYNAITREWPMTIADAAAELGEATRHMQNATLPWELMTDATASDIAAWQNSISSNSRQLSGMIAQEEQLSELGTDSLKELARNAWQILALLDRELTGLENNQVDPGRMP